MMLICSKYTPASVLSQGAYLITAFEEDALEG